jgi:prepilin-type N-terminal cleavage/methylation domain-containing protein
MKTNRAFTLIELLVVISIISLLSSVVFASLSDAREKGRIAAAQKFSSGMDHAIRDELVGEWTFDNDTLVDTSGFGNDGQFVSAPIGYTDGVFERGVQFTGGGSPKRTTGGYIQLNANLDVDSNNHSISFWYKSSQSYFQMLFQRELVSTNSNIEFAPSNNTIHVEGIVNNIWQKEFDTGIDIDDGRFHHYALVFSGADSRLYVDGSLSDIKSENTDIPDFRYRFFGGYGNTTWPYGESPTGVMDDVRIYSKALSTAQIQQLYAEGLANNPKFAQQ